MPNDLDDLTQRDLKSVDGALQALEQNGGHELDHPLLATAGGRATMLIGVLGRRAGMEIDRGQVDRERERGKRLCDLRICTCLLRGR